MLVIVLQLLLALILTLGCSDTEPDGLGREDARLLRFFERWEAAAPIDERPEPLAILAALDAKFPVSDGWQREVRLRRESPTVVLAWVDSWDSSTTIYQPAVVEWDAARWAVEEPIMTYSISCCFGPSDPVEIGEQEFIRVGCAQCHSRDGSPGGPSLHGLIGRERRLSDGRVVVADEAYIRRTIIARDRPTLQGWEPTMPSYSRMRLSDREIDALVAYVKSLDEPK